VTISVQVLHVTHSFIVNKPMYVCQSLQFFHIYSCLFVAFLGSGMPIFVS